jgi:hypothetical protein
MPGMRPSCVLIERTAVAALSRKQQVGSVPDRSAALATFHHTGPDHQTSSSDRQQEAHPGCFDDEDATHQHQRKSGKLNLARGHPSSLRIEVASSFGSCRAITARQARAVLIAATIAGRQLGRHRGEPGTIISSLPRARGGFVCQTGRQGTPEWWSMMGARATLAEGKSTRAATLVAGIRLVCSSVRGRRRYPDGSARPRQGTFFERQLEPAQRFHTVLMLTEMPSSFRIQARNSSSVISGSMGTSCAAWWHH